MTKKGKKLIHKQYDIEIKSVDDEKREIVAVGSQQKVDRDGDIVKVDGIDFSAYKKNPIVLWSHKHSDPPIGKTERVWKDGNKLMFKINYADAETYSFADTIYKLTKGGYINAFSIGFAPDWKEAEPNEKSGGYNFNKTELLEISSVNVPANAGALIQTRSIQKAMEDKVIDDVELKEVELYLEKNLIADIEEDESDADEELEQTIKEDSCPHCGRKYMQKEDDNDPFDWLFKEIQTTESTDDPNEDLVDELLNDLNGDK